MDTSLCHKIKQAEEPGVDMKDRHGDRHNGSNLDKFVLSPIFYGFGRGQFAVQRGYVDLLVLFFCHKIESFPYYRFTQYRVLHKARPEPRAPQFRPLAH